MTPFTRSPLFICAIAAHAVSLLPAATARGGDDPFADSIVAFDPGSGGAPGFDDPATVLGSPERFTGEGLFPVVVSPFSPAFGTDELVSLGTGGFITVQFNTPVVDDPGNPHGIDLLIFGNTGFIDAAFPNGVVGGLFGNDGGTVEVSADGIDWFLISGAMADGMFPTLGYLDSGPYDEQPGAIMSDFTRPLNPALTFNDFDGLDYQAVLDLYDGSGGGAGIDIASTGLGEISFVRISNMGADNVEIEAFADVAVPAPAAAFALLAPGFSAASVRRRRRS